MSKELLRLRAHLSKSNNGTSILFTGAGFSFGAENIKGQMPKDSIHLSRAICKIAKIGEDDDLYYSSEYCIDNSPHHELVDLLKFEYSIKAVSKSHELIAKKRWRRKPLLVASAYGKNQQTYGNLVCKFVKNYDGDTITVNIPDVHPIIGKRINVRINGI